MKKKYVLAGLLLIMLMLTACGKKAEITIHDGGVDTKVEVSLPKTVDEILKEAEITVAEKDDVNPAGGTELQGAAEITIRRMLTVSIKTDDGDVKNVEILSNSTVKDVLAQEGITLAENQSLNVKEEDTVQTGMTIRITTSNGVTVVHDGKTEQIDFGVGTVGDVLEQMNISLGTDDTVTPDKKEAVKNGTKIVITRVTFEEITTTEEIPYETVREDDSSLEKGSEKVKTEGVAGEKTTTYRVKMVDGKEDSRETVKSEVTKEPVNEVIRVGTKAGRYEVSRVAVPNCADGSHGYYEITYSDGSKEYVEY
ncbi:MAG: G5 domain-containing protein [Eubacterium sp.]|nr:G5 domain-containing protein [Eubacterium sp.]